MILSVLVCVGGEALGRQKPQQLFYWWSGPTSAGIKLTWEQNHLLNMILYAIVSNSTGKSIKIFFFIPLSLSLSLSLCGHETPQFFFSFFEGLLVVKFERK